VVIVMFFIEAYKSTDAKLKEFEYEGCTSTTVLLWRNNGKRYLQAANVGDSSAFLFRNGTAVPLSVDHRPNEPSEIERLISEGFKITPGQTRLNGIAVSRALGDHFPKQVNIGLTCEPFVSEVKELEHTDTALIVATDGLWDVISGQRACSILQDDSNITAKEMAKKLLKTALQSRKCMDNVTVTVTLLN